MRHSSQLRQTALWLAALAIGTILGLLHLDAIDAAADFIATVYARLFRLLAVPTIALAIASTLSTFGTEKDTGRIFRHTVAYTLLTTLSAAAVGLLLYLAVSPGNLPEPLVAKHAGAPAAATQMSYGDHILSVVPDNIIRPFLEGNVLSILIISAAAGFAVSRMKDTASKDIIVKGIAALQELLFTLIRGLIWTLPLGITAFAAQFSAQMAGGMAAASIGKYVAVILGGNILQMAVVLPLFLAARGLNVAKVAKAMSPAVLMAFFTKSSAATLPVTMSQAENALKVSPRVARFVLPVCTTVNMNGCAAFILVTSLYVMQHGDFIPTTGGIFSLALFYATWLLLAVVSAVGNAGVPMGCYFLTLSLMTGIGAPAGIMGIILPIYTVIDMVETAENVWSDSCVCAMTNHDTEHS